MSKRKIPNGYLDDNARFQDFRAELEKRGCRIRWAWGAKSNPDLQHDNIHCALFYGDGFQPTVLTAIVLDYNVARGDNMGFGLFMDAPSRSIVEDADLIAKPRELAAA